VTAAAWRSRLSTSRPICSGAVSVSSPSDAQAWASSTVMAAELAGPSPASSIGTTSQPAAASAASTA
jgi:hypothetical protein